MSTGDLFGGPPGVDAPGGAFNPDAWRRAAFETDLSGLTVRDQIVAVERELGYRSLLYPRWLKEGRISWAESIWQVRAMRAALETLRRAEERGVER